MEAGVEEIPTRLGNAGSTVRPGGRVERPTAATTGGPTRATRPRGRARPSRPSSSLLSRRRTRGGVRPRRSRRLCAASTGPRSDRQVLRRDGSLGLALGSDLDLGRSYDAGAVEVTGDSGVLYFVGPGSGSSGAGGGAAARAGAAGVAAGTAEGGGGGGGRGATLRRGGGRAARAAGAVNGRATATGAAARVGAAAETKGGTKGETWAAWRGAAGGGRSGGGGGGRGRRRRRSRRRLSIALSLGCSRARVRRGGGSAARKLPPANAVRVHACLQEGSLRP